MAINANPDIRCGSHRHAKHDPQPPAVAVVQDQSFSGWWAARCQPCIDEYAIYPVTLNVAYLRGHDPAADPDHPGHVHYADGVSADHPTNI